MPAAADIGTGAAITFQSGFFALITNISWSGWERQAIDISTMANTNNARTFMPSDLHDAGTLEVECLWDADDGVKTAMTASSETVTITYPVQSGGMTAATRAASGFLISASHEVPLEDKMTATYTIKLTGAVTETAST